MALELALEITDDGSATLRSPVYGETYHSLRGAAGEARHVFVEAGLLRAAEDKTTAGDNPDTAVRILEMGFGTGLNAWLTLCQAQQSGRNVEYTAVELHPISEQTAAALGYTGDGRFAAMHRAQWGERTEISKGFGLLKVHSDLTEFLAGTNFSTKFDVVYYDAFAPDTQPELWSEEIFGRIFELTAPGGILVTYSAKGDVRRALRAAGFEVEKLPGALGKRHMLRAIKI